MSESEAAVRQCLVQAINRGMGTAMGKSQTRRSRYERPSEILSYRSWNNVLFDHFFAWRGDRESTPIPVARLNVTKEELFKATGCSEGDKEEAYESFVTMIRAQLRSTLLQTHIRNDAGTVAHQKRSRPITFALLAFSCLVAVEDDDAWADESAYSKALKEACGGDKGHSGAGLCDAWEEIREWLALVDGSDNQFVDADTEKSIRYRPLVLPKTRKYQHLGHSLDLAFPSRRDFETMTRILQSFDNTEIASVEKILTAFNHSKASFTSSFARERANFEKNYQGSNRKGYVPALCPFWNAVKAAWERSKGINTSLVTIAAHLRDDEQEPYIFIISKDALGSRVDWESTSQSEDIEGLRDFGQDWTHIVTLGDEGDPEADTVAINALLRNELGASASSPFHNLRSIAKSGLLLFEAVDSENYLLVKGTRLRRTRRYCGLIRDGERLPHGIEVDPVPCAIPSWKAIPAFLYSGQTSESSSVLDVEENFNATLRDGVPCGSNTYLGWKELLPIVQISDANSVVLESLEDSKHSVSLVSRNEGDWEFRAEDIKPGNYELRAALRDHTSVKRRIKFAIVEPLRSMRTPPDESRWFGESGGNIDREGSRGLEVRSSKPDRRPADMTVKDKPLQETDFSDVAQEVARVYLGAAMGQFSLVPKPGFVWRADGHAIPKAGTTQWMWTTTYVGDGDSQARRATTQTTNTGQRRHWRKRIKNISKATSAPPEVVASYRRNGRDEETAEHIDDFPESPPRQSQFAVDRHSSLHKVETVLATLFRRRNKGASLGELRQLFVELLHLDKRQSQEMVWDLIRSWNEIGAIDYLCSNTYWTRAFYGVAPRLHLYSEGTKTAGVLVGLVSDTLRDRIHKNLPSSIEQTTTGRSASPLVPGLARYTSTDVEAYAALAAKVGLAPARWLGKLDSWIHPVENTFSTFDASNTDATPYSYVDWRTGQGASEALDSIQVARIRRPRNQEFYRVSVDGQPRWQSNLRSWAIWCARRYANEPSFRFPEDRLEIRSLVRGVYLPLSTARLLAFLGPASPGPVHDSGSYRHVYPVCSMQLRQHVKAALGPKL